MADYFTDFSVTIELEKEEREWAMQLNRYLNCLYHAESTTMSYPVSIVKAAGELINQLGEDYCPQCIVSELHLKDSIIVLSDGEVHADITACYIQAVLKQFNINRSVRMNVAYTCSRPIPDGFGGDVCIITRKDIAWLNVDEWIVNKEAELLEKLKEEESGEKSGEKA